MQNKIAAVIVTYNRLEKLKKAIAAVLDQPIDYVVVVNNKSNDGTREWLDAEKSKDSRLIIEHLEENTGGAGGFYHGTKYATENTDADWLILFDDDAYPREDLIKKFKSRTLPADVGGVTCAVYTPDDEIADFNRPGKNPFNSLGEFCKYLGSGPYLSYEDLKNSQSMHVDFSSFVGFCVRTSVIREGLGYPQKDLFIYCDDWLYTLALSKLGYKNLYFADLVFYHDSKTFVDSYDAQLWKQFYAYRNSLKFYKEASGLFFPVVFTMKLVKWLFAARHYKNKSAYFETLGKALKEGVAA